MRKIYITPTPKSIKISNKHFSFDGFSNFPEFFHTEFDIPKGKWIIDKISGKGTGFTITDGKVLFWGDEYIVYASLIQIMRQIEGVLPEIEVEEDFEFEFRGYHLDIARGGVPTPKTFKTLLKWLFILKYNYLAIYFEDLFPWEKYPDIGLRRGRLSRDELKEIILYGRRLGIEVFPSLELIGHMEQILTLPPYEKFSEWYHPGEGCINLGDDEAKRFSLELLEEVLDYFPSQYIHIGGDETWALGRGKSLNKRWVFEGDKLYEEHHKDMINMVYRYGKIPIMWGDMLTGAYLTQKEKKRWQTVLKSDIWDKVLIDNWNYKDDPEATFLEEIDLFGRHRIEKEISSPGFTNWNRYYPDFQVAFTNIKNFSSASKKRGIKRFLVTSWGDDGQECLFSFLDPLLLYNIEIFEGKGNFEDNWEALSGENRELTNIRKAFGRHNLQLYLKYLLFSDRWNYLKDRERKLKEELKILIGMVSGITLPSDLEFIKRLIDLGLKKLESKIQADDFIALSEYYTSLWLSERKKEGLSKVLGKFWNQAGIYKFGL